MAHDCALGVMVGIAPRSSPLDARTATCAESATRSERFGPNSSEYRAWCTVKLVARSNSKQRVLHDRVATHIADKASEAVLCQ